MKFKRAGRKNYTTPKTQKQFTAYFIFVPISKKSLASFYRIPIYHNLAR
jgi:hypothetical protein